MRKITLTVAYILGLLFITGCANQRPNLAYENTNWQKDTPPTANIRHTVYMTGDAGRIESTPVLDLLKKKLSAADENTSMVFLGNQLYPNGMPPKDEVEERQQAEYQLDVQLSILKDFKGRPLFIPGNRDWKKYGLKGVKRQEKYIEKKLKELDFDTDDLFLPDDGCGDFNAIDINDQLGIIAIDSEWYLHDWDQEPEINDGCEIKSLKVFDFNLQDAIRKYRNKNAIIVMHHPPVSGGIHGGRYPVKEHIFPLTAIDKSLFLPLPVVGSVGMFARAIFGSRQDLSNGQYKLLRQSVVGSAEKNGSYIFASSHDRSMQYLTENDQHFIVAGSATSSTPASLVESGEFAYGAAGFTQLDFYEDGSVWLQFWTASGENGQVVFRKKIKEALEISEDDIPTQFSEYESGITSKTLHPLEYEVTNKNGFHDLIFGEHYRELYTHQFEFPVLHLDTFKGGVKVVKRGGGNQTRSLRLEDENGRQYSMRAMTKDVSRLLPYPFNQISAAEYIAEDNFLSTHPFAPLAVPYLADAVKVYHTNPQFYYIPKQPILDVHNESFGGEVYLVEERPDDDWS
ncbi:MAG: metallophosphoesterase, partial [Saprospiraceae bacterium]